MLVKEAQVQGLLNLVLGEIIIIITCYLITVILYNAVGMTGISRSESH